MLYFWWVGVGGMSRNLFCSYLSFFLPFLFGAGRTSILTYPLAIPSKPHAIFRSKQLKSIVLENTLSILLIKPNICFYSPTDTASQGSRDGAVVRALASHQCGPGVRFSKLPKTFRARKAPRKAPENDFWCFSKHANISDPRKVASFFPDNLRVLESSRNAFSGMFF